MGIIRLTLFSVIGVGGAMLWFGRDEGLPEDRLGYTPHAPDVVVTAPLTNPKPSAAPVTPPPTSPAPAPVVVSAVQPTSQAPAIATPAPIPTAVVQPAVEPPPQPAPTAPPKPTLFVTGSTVNMRAGTSTQEAIVAKLRRGTAVTYLGEPILGWSEIRVIETGAQGFMASRFLSPDAP